MSTLVYATGADPIRRGGSADGPRFTGTRLRLAQVAWLVLALASIASFFLTLPQYYAGFSQVCDDACAFNAAQERALNDIGISIQNYVLGTIVLSTLILLVSATISFILFLRRSDEWMVLLVAYFLVVYPVANIGAVSGTGEPSAMTALDVVLSILTIPNIFAFYGVFLLFPSGRFVPRWSWLVLAAWTVWFVVINFLPDALGGALVAGYPVFYLTAIAFQVYRYRRVSMPVERQQTKWVVFGFIASLLANQVFWLVGPQVGGIFAPAVYVVYQLCLLLVPITFFIAVQRYRLYDIDRLINRALVYGSLTAILAVVYFGIIVVAQAVVRQVTGQSEQPTAVIVASTLLIAALVQPLRRRIQSGIDRRFYRSKYDAAQAVAQFSATLRNEVDAAQLSDHLMGVVEETMQPEHASLWLRPRG